MRVNAELLLRIPPKRRCETLMRLIDGFESVQLVRGSLLAGYPWKFQTPDVW